MGQFSREIYIPTGSTLNGNQHRRPLALDCAHLHSPDRKARRRIQRGPGQLTQRVELAEAKAAEKRASSQ